MYPWNSLMTFHLKAKKGVKIAAAKTDKGNPEIQVQDQ